MKTRNLPVVLELLQVSAGNHGAPVPAQQPPGNQRGGLASMAPAASGHAGLPASASAPEQVAGKQGDSKQAQRVSTARGSGETAAQQGRYTAHNAAAAKASPLAAASHTAAAHTTGAPLPGQAATSGHWEHSEAAAAVTPLTADAASPAAAGPAEELHATVYLLGDGQGGLLKVVDDGSSHDDGVFYAAVIDNAEVEVCIRIGMHAGNAKGFEQTTLTLS